MLYRGAKLLAGNLSLVLQSDDEVMIGRKLLCHEVKWMVECGLAGADGTAGSWTWAGFHVAGQLSDTGLDSSDAGLDG